MTWMQISWMGLVVSLVLGVGGLSSAFAGNLKPLTAKEKKAFFNSTEDRLNKKPCKGRARVTLHCRDKLHYVKSNERHHQAFRPYIRNLGGAYMGVGSDQAFTFMAWAKSTHGFLVDYDPVVVWINHAHLCLIRHSATKAQYIRRWQWSGRRSSVQLLKKCYPRHRRLSKMIWAYSNWRRVVNNHFIYMRNLRRERIQKTKDRRKFHWLHSKKSYQYVRKMVLANRIRVLKADLLLNKGVRGAGAVSHRIGVPIRVLYLSNAEAFWPYVRNFRKNMRSLKMDSRSVVIRTAYTSRYGPRLGYWIYAIQKGQSFQKRLTNPKLKRVWQLFASMKKLSRGVYRIVPSKK